jgi:hypothetical protein
MLSGLIRLSLVAQYLCFKDSTFLDFMVIRFLRFISPS